MNCSDLRKHPRQAVYLTNRRNRMQNLEMHSERWLISVLWSPREMRMNSYPSILGIMVSRMM
jgi:hypothetical protein